MKDNHVTFLYLDLGGGRATIAIRLNADNTVEVGAAFCSPLDRFVKDYGRKLALERIKSKKDFYINYERDENNSLKSQAKDVVKFVVAGQWVTVLDFDIELNTTVYEIITESSADFPCEIGPMTVHTNVVPHWAKQAVIERNFY